jgi:cytochrome P450
MAEVHKNKPVHFSFPFQDPVIFVNDPIMLEHILKTRFSVYDKGVQYHNICKDVIGNGIFNSDGERWRVKRKVAASIFSVKSFKEAVGVVFVEEMDLLNVKLAEYARTGKEFDLQELFFRFTLDAFCKMAFSYDLKSMADDEPVPFAKAFDEVQNHVKNRFQQPFWKLLEYITPAAARNRVNRKIVKDFAREVVKGRRIELTSNMSGSENKRNDLISYLLKSKDENGNPPSDEEMAEFALNILIAGIYNPFF